SELAYSHHGSLSRAVRAVVEQRLKAGTLRAIVATSSLEMGIDIGSLDEVLLVQTPRSVAAAVQRIGRAGHQVGEVSRGAFYPTHGRDVIDAAVVARCLLAGDIESVAPPRAPLDVLAQVLLGRVCDEVWTLDALYDHIRCAAPYAELTREAFELVIEMLAGRYADDRLRTLHPRVVLDRAAGTITARKGANRLLYMAGGTIPDRGYFALRVEGSLAKIGELDEEFVWERSIGDRFTLGPQGWQIRAINHNDVIVAPSPGPAPMAPFWRADAEDRGVHLATRTAEFLADAERDLSDRSGAGRRALRVRLAADHQLDPPAALGLIELLDRQRAMTGRLPHARQLLVEHVVDGGGADAQNRTVIHTFWGGAVNRPLAVAIAAAWEAARGTPLETLHDDDGVMVVQPDDADGPLDAAALLALVPPDQVGPLLRRRLEQTGFFGAQFRMAASTALLLPRAGPKRRTPLWLHRQRAKTLLDAVRGHEDFPVMVETWRSCLQDVFALDALRDRLERVQAGEIGIAELHTRSPSPFAANLVRTRTNRLMYEDDAPEAAAGPSALRDDLVMALIDDPAQRPRVGRATIDDLERRLQRLAPGYAPSSSRDELLLWLAERGLLPRDDWDRLVAAIRRDQLAEGDDDDRLDASDVVALRDAIAERAVWLTLPGAAMPAAVHVERLDGLLRALGLDDADVGLVDFVAEPVADAADRPPPRAAWQAARAALAARRTPSSNAQDGDAADDDAVRTARVVDWLSGWLAFYGPLPLAQLDDVFGRAFVDRRAALVDALAGDARVIIGALAADGVAADAAPTAPVEVCDVENLARLLRLQRQQARPAFEALPREQLGLFLAVHQGITDPGAGYEDLQERLEPLFGWPAAAGQWEGDLLPARLAPYRADLLDRLLRESDLRWFGCGDARLTFGFAEDQPLLLEGLAARDAEGDENDEGSNAAALEDAVARLLPDP
ncbi:MAG: helicase-related protein, partial [Acidobacteriota bacterium]